MLLKGAILLLAITCQLSNVAALNDKGRKIVNFLWQNQGKKMLSGAFGGYIGVGNSDGFSQNEANEIKAWTKKLPAIYAVDCAQGWGKTAHGRETDLIQCMNQAAVDYANKGAIISVSHHLPNPLFAGNNAGGNDGAYNHKISNDEYAQLLKEGTPARNRWYQMLNKIADGLASYQAKGITVIYRPFHEMNGEWFWWGATGYNTNDKTRFELFKQLWRDMHNYFTNYRKLNNLVWLFSPDAKRGYKSHFFPGDQYVDIVGLDVYLDNFDAMEGYEEMLGLRKPFGMAEVGPDKNMGSFDYGAMVNTILSKFPKTTFFVPWNNKWSPTKNKNAWGAYNNGRVMNLGEFSI